MLSELQWDRLCNLINGLPQIDWYVYQVEISGDYLYSHSRSIFSSDNPILFIINAKGDII